jgi:hypothetical protein
MLFIELDTVSRARRKLQAKDNAVWHKLASSVPPHHCILPTEEAMVQAKLVEEAYKSWAVRL